MLFNSYFKVVKGFTGVFLLIFSDCAALLKAIKRGEIRSKEIK
jgi:hypothetical protein